jgi:N,N'-diacetyllegionaminate synthase
MSLYIYAETAFHHEGDKNYLLRLVDAAKKACVDGVKFQVLIELDEFMSTRHSAFSEVGKWIFTEQEWGEIFAYTKKLGLDIILMPLDKSAFKFISEFDIRYVEIHSVSFKDEELFEILDDVSSSVIFGIGGRTIEEIDFVVKRYEEREVTLMVGFQSFPTVLKDVKLLKIQKLAKSYPKCIIGYADHSSFSEKSAILSNEYAYLLGARVFEKHITLDEGSERTDYQSAVNFKKLFTIRNKLEYLEYLLDSNERDVFDLNEKELMYRNRQKTPVAKRDIKPGEVISRDMIALKMNDIENNLEFTKFITGKTSNKIILKDNAFYSGDLE